MLISMDVFLAYEITFATAPQIVRIHEKALILTVSSRTTRINNYIPCNWLINMLRYVNYVFAIDMDNRMNMGNNPVCIRIMNTELRRIYDWLTLVAHFIHLLDHHFMIDNI